MPPATKHSNNANLGYWLPFLLSSRSSSLDNKEDLRSLAECTGLEELKHFHLHSQAQVSWCHDTDSGEYPPPGSVPRATQRGFPLGSWSLPCISLQGLACPLLCQDSGQYAHQPNLQAEGFSGNHHGQMGIQGAGSARSPLGASTHLSCLASAATARPTCAAGSPEHFCHLLQQALLTRALS